MNFPQWNYFLDIYGKNCNPFLLFIWPVREFRVSRLGSFHLFSPFTFRHSCFKSKYGILPNF